MSLMLDSDVEDGNRTEDEHNNSQRYYDAQEVNLVNGYKVMGPFMQKTTGLNGEQMEKGQFEDFLETVLGSEEESTRLCRGDFTVWLKQLIVQIKNLSSKRAWGVVLTLLEDKIYGFILFELFPTIPLRDDDLFHAHIHFVCHADVYPSVGNTQGMYTTSEEYVLKLAGKTKKQSVQLSLDSINK